jgi:hypothetical protein
MKDNERQTKADFVKRDNENHYIAERNHIVKGFVWKAVEI